MSELTRLRDEADRLLTTYVEHKDCNDKAIRLRVHVHLDRFLMSNRELVTQLMLMGLDAEIQRLAEELQLEFEAQAPKPSLLDRLLRHLRIVKDEESNMEPDNTSAHADPEQPASLNQ